MRPIFGLFRRPQSQKNRRFLFVCGCPRSGTTAMQQLFARHPETCVGSERYYTVAAKGRRYDESLFEKERFLTLRPSDTYYPQATFDASHDGFAEKFDRCRYVGDKIPTLYERLSDLFAFQPTPTVIFMLRNIWDVAESHNQRARNPKDAYWTSEMDGAFAVEQWNRSLKVALKTLRGPNRDNLIVVEYESFFDQGETARGLLKHLGLTINEDVGRTVDQMVDHCRRIRQRKRMASRELSVEQKKGILLRADVASYRRLLPHANRWQNAAFPFLSSWKAA